MSGIERVKANAPSTPSIENVASITSRYRIFDRSLIPDFPEIKSFSAFSAFSLNPCVMKNAVEPITAPNASIGLILSAYHTTVASNIDTVAKNHTP
jgi:hypothetical protein